MVLRVNFKVGLRIKENYYNIWGKKTVIVLEVKIDRVMSGIDFSVPDWNIIILVNIKTFYI